MTIAFNSLTEVPSAVRGAAIFLFALLDSPRILSTLCVSALAFSFCAFPTAVEREQTYLGFDRNQYPGDEAMKLLRKDFTFTGYWLSPPPGETANTWQGKREYLRSLGYGFLLLYSGPNSAALKSAAGAIAKATADAKAASAAAQTEHFSAGGIVFADIEEGGRLTVNYHAYLKAWAEALRRSGFKPGAYSSGMPVHEGKGVVITTADDIHADPHLADFVFWIYNDACPPSRGCQAEPKPPAPPQSGTGYASIWQYAQSPRRKQFTARCATKYAADGNCYAPSDAAHKWFLDMNTATSADPSGGAN